MGFFLKKINYPLFYHRDDHFPLRLDHGYEGFSCAEDLCELKAPLLDGY